MGLNAFSHRPLFSQPGAPAGELRPAPSLNHALSAWPSPRPVWAAASLPHPGVLGVRGVQWAFQVLSQSLRTRRSRDPSAAGSQRGTGRDCRHQGQSWSVLVALPDPARRQRAAALRPAAGGVDEALGAEGQGCTGTPDPAVQPPPAPWAGPRAGPPPACSAHPLPGNPGPRGMGLKCFA